ncbi:hypothetical protein Vafri_3551 [Volvox africanus]|uniref:Kinesin-like protein KIN-8B n=1 Tax=Volvox africanus TaxID=51714 RepID=A0A8J4AVN9_9CHLO|nr:hypothetical protein Vafri_3551 [Volvox africanus]
MARESKAPVKLSSVVDASRYVSASTAATLTVGIRVRPLVRAEIARGARRDIIRVLDSRVVVVLDPDENKDYLDQVQNRTKEKRYTFDIAFGTSCTNRDVYNGTVRDLIGGVLQGINTTVFAYGATGSGKTYTMVGTPQDPGLMVLCLEKIFADRDTSHRDEEFCVTCSYLEVYNEIIYDLLVKSSSPLELREDPELGVVVAGLKHITVTSAAEIMTLLEDGNRRRKTEATDANASSSRSHAVLEITVKRTPKNHYKVTQLRGKLSLVDLAGSERAAETNNAGQKLRDGANINRSLLALANCINALGKANSGKSAASYVPYRNSKLTRLLKDGLSGNSRTAMVATVSGSSDQYHHSINTLKYADRAKEIKTHVVQNVGTVESHVADYQRIIDNLQSEVQDLRAQLIEREAARPPGVSKPRTSEEDLLALIGKLVEEMNDNIEERINLQKALFEIEDANLYNKHEMGQLEEFLDTGKGSARDITEARERRAEVLEATRENDRERERYKSEITANELARKDIQARVQAIVDSNQSAAFLNLLSTFRLQALHLQELKFQMAVRDQIIGEQRQVIGNLWKIIDKSGLPREKVVAVAKAEGIIMDGLQGGDGGPPTVGVVPLSEALKAVKEEMGISDLRVTPELPNAHPVGIAKRVSERQLRYRAWPATSPTALDAPPGDARSASADASPYGTDDEGMVGSDDDSKSVRSDKSPLRGRGSVAHRPSLGHQISATTGAAAAAVSAAVAGITAVEHRGQQHVHIAREVSNLGEDAAVAATAAMSALAPVSAVRRLSGVSSMKGHSSSGAGSMKPAGGTASGTMGSTSACNSISGGAPSGAGSPGQMGRRRIPGAPLSAKRSDPQEPLVPPPQPSRMEHIKSGRRAGQHRPKPSSELGDLSSSPGYDPATAASANAAATAAAAAAAATASSGSNGASRVPSSGNGAGAGGVSVIGRSSENGGSVVNSGPRISGVGSISSTALGGSDSDGRAHGRRRHTVAHDVSGANGFGTPFLGAGGSAAGIAAEGSVLENSDEGFEGLTHLVSEASRISATRSDSTNLMAQASSQATLNERLARLKGRLASAAAIAALPLPGETSPTSPPPVLAGGASSVTKR